MNFLKSKSVTLTELAVTVVIIAIIAGVAIPFYNSAIEKQKDKEAKAALEIIAAAENKYFLHNDDYYPDGSNQIISVYGIENINTALGLRIPDAGNWEYCIEARGGLDYASPRARRLTTNGRVWRMILNNGVTISGPLERDYSDWCYNLLGP